MTSSTSSCGPAGANVLTVVCGVVSPVWSFALPSEQFTGSVTSAARSLSITVGLKKYTRTSKQCTMSVQSASYLTLFNKPPRS